MKKILSIFMLLVAFTTGAWAAAALTKDFKVTGYKAVNLFDFQNKDYDGTALTSFDDLPGLGVSAQNTVGSAYGNNNWYDDTANGRGLRLQSGGGRWIQLTVDIEKDDYIIINGGAASEAYEISMTNGESAVVSEASDYLCFKATQKAASLRLTVHRYNYLTQILIMTKDEAAKTADYTINYKDGEEIVKTVSGNEAVGTVIPVLSIISEGGKKYVTDEGQASSLTIAEGDNILNINVTEVVKYSCKVNLFAGNTPLSSVSTSVYEDESETIYYSKAYQYDEQWYFIDANAVSPGYGVEFKNVKADAAENITTFEAWNKVVYFAEAEDLTIFGSWAANGSYLNWRSNGMSKRLAKSSYIYTGVIAPGIYNVTLQARNNRSAGDGTESVALFLRDEEGNLTDLSTSFPGWARGGYEGAHNATIAIPDDGKNYSIVINNNTEWNSNLELDYLYVEKFYISGTLPESGIGTIASAYAIDCANLPSGVKAYQVTEVEGEGATLTEVKEAVAPGTGLILRGTAGVYEIPVVAEGTDISSTNKLEAAVTATTLEDGTFYIMQGGQFHLVEGAADDAARTVPAGKAYLPAASLNGAKTISLSFGEITGIDQIENGELNIENSLPVKRVVNGQLVIEKNGQKFNANGQLVY